MRSPFKGFRYELPMFSKNPKLNLYNSVQLQMGLQLECEIAFRCGAYDNEDDSAIYGCQKQVLENLGVSPQRLGVEQCSRYLLLGRRMYSRLYRVWSMLAYATCEVTKYFQLLLLCNMFVILFQFTRIWHNISRVVSETCNKVVRLYTYIIFCTTSLSRIINLLTQILLEVRAIICPRLDYSKKFTFRSERHSKLIAT